MNKSETRAHPAGIPNKAVPQQLPSKDALESIDTRVGKTVRRDLVTHTTTNQSNVKSSNGRSSRNFTKSESPIPLTLNKKFGPKTA